MATNIVNAPARKTVRKSFMVTMDVLESKKECVFVTLDEYRDAVKEASELQSVGVHRLVLLKDHHQEAEAQRWMKEDLPPLLSLISSLHGAEVVPVE